jgi:hypothetical protein
VLCLEKASSRLRTESCRVADKSHLKLLRRTRPLPRRMPRNRRCTGPRNHARARSRYAKTVNEAIRRDDADETRAGNSQNRQVAVVRSFSTEAAARFHRCERVHFSAMTSQREDCFLQLLSDSHRFRRQNVHSAYRRNFRTNLDKHCV